MSVRLCSHRLSMQSDVLNDSNNGLSTDIDCSPTLPTTLIYSGLKLHPKPLVPTISMPSMANPLSIVKTLSLSDPHGDNSTKSLSTSPSIRLVTSTTGKSSPPTALQLQVVEKSTNPNGSYSTSKTFFFNHQQSSNSSSLVTLIPPGSTSSKIQTFLSSTNDFNNGNDFQHSNKSSPTTTTTASFLTKNRLTLVQPIVTTSSTSSSTSSSTTTSVTPKLVIQPNSTSNIWSPQSTTKILSAKMISHPVQLISSTEHSNENPLFTSKPLESSHSSLIHMSVVPSASTESTSTVRLNNSRPMDHNNNHSISTEEKCSESNSMKNVHSTKVSMKNRTRLPLQPSSQQISSILPSTTKKQKLSNEEETSPLEPPRKIVHGESSMEKKIRKSRHRSSTMKTSIENAIPSSSSTGSTANESIPSKKRSSAELAAAAILSSSHLRKKRMFRKTSDEFTTNSIEDSSITPINDELMKTLSQDFFYEDQRTGIRWIATKSRSQPINTLSSRVSWKPKINHYEKYSDVIRMNSKRTVPIRSPETIRKKFMEPSASWRIDRLTSYLTDLTDDEQRTQNALSDIGRSLTQLNIDDEQFRQNIDDLIEENLQRHRSFSEQLTQISSLLVQLMNHGNTLKEISSSNKTTPLSNSTRRTKER